MPSTGKNVGNRSPHVLWGEGTLVQPGEEHGSASKQAPRRAQPLKALADKPDGLGLIPGSHMVERQKHTQASMFSHDPCK